MSENETPAPASPEAPKKAKKQFGINFKVSAKGAVSVYGLGRFPVTLYREQWLRLLEKTDDLRKFMDEHADDLRSKSDAQAEAAAAPEPAAATEPAAADAPAAEESTSASAAE